MFSKANIRGLTFRPALCLAPLAGITHCSFRRLVAEGGGCGCFFTEMLSARHVLNEDLHRSPYLRRSPGERMLVYQLMVHAADPLEEVIG
ncbi:MAG: tRNA-dihydrouridine synthase, partial [Kiritimatiellae bacterium]|nr:tRNA-dihydrouridine synthase [Kiritimatiellia bacterium]